MKRGYSIQAKNETEAEIFIYEEIGEYWGSGITAKQFAKDLRALGDKIELINVRLNSPGGDVFDGNTIYNLLNQHKATKNVYVDGLAASIASVIAMSGNRIYMADNAMMMIHPAWGLSIGNADDMRKMAEMLDKVDASILQTYMKRTKQKEEKIHEMMLAETWMSSQEAVDLGFADEIVDALELAAHFDLSKFRYRNTPKSAQAPAGDYRCKLAKLNLAAQRIRSASTPR